MNQNIVVLQGKRFVVELPSMYGSTEYGWCLSSMPKELILLGTEHINASSEPVIGPVKQIFYFGAVSAAEKVGLEFVLTSAMRLSDVRDSYSAEVHIIPDQAKEFVPYSENANVKYGYACGAEEVSKASMPYGMIYNENANLKYGYPCGVEEASKAMIPYGVVYNSENANLKYGYPCGVKDATLMYGYPCAMDTPFFRNGNTGMTNTPFFRDGDPGGRDAVIKYGYPCTAKTPFFKRGISEDTAR